MVSAQGSRDKTHWKLSRVLRGLQSWLAAKSCCIKSSLLEPFPKTEGAVTWLFQLHDYVHVPSEFNPRDRLQSSFIDRVFDRGAIESNFSHELACNPKITSLMPTTHFQQTSKRSWFYTGWTPLAWCMTDTYTTMRRSPVLNDRVPWDGIHLSVSCHTEWFTRWKANRKA